VSIDHPDVQDTNALVRDDDGSIVLLDWEEATLGCPFFSLHRLLREADLANLTDPVRRAYVDSLRPWGDATAVNRWIDVALILAPLKLATEARTFARTLGLDHPHTNYTTRLITDSLQNLTSATR
jgi:aminoglycoside phosphotransferase (APT) family kinase protein